jgi:hypothetical protein
VTAHLGNEGWPRPQFVAIVGAYWRRRADPRYVAEKLGVSVALIESIYEHFEHTALYLDTDAWRWGPGKH